ncbi:hypothetical protein TWF281_008506 [Arthrobotrys megalospora]
MSIASVTTAEDLEFGVPTPRPSTSPSMEYARTYSAESERADKETYESHVERFAVAGVCRACACIRPAPERSRCGIEVFWNVLHDLSIHFSFFIDIKPTLSVNYVIPDMASCLKSSRRTWPGGFVNLAQKALKRRSVRIRTSPTYTLRWALLDLTTERSIEPLSTLFSDLQDLARPETNSRRPESTFLAPIS